MSGLKNRRVVVTGLGLLSPLGNSPQETWQALLAGKSGVRKITDEKFSKFGVKIGAPVDSFQAEKYFEPKEIRKISGFIQYAVGAAKQAIDDAGLEITEENAPRFGVIMGSGIGGLPLIEKNYLAYLNGGPRRISPSFIPMAIINMASGMISIKFGLQGPSYAIVSACTSSAHSIGDAARIIGYGDADVMVAGGTEMANTPLGLGGFAAARALSRRNDEPTKASRPWDKDRDGFVLADGAGALILEEYEHAKKRGAKIYAELTGFGMSSDAYHVTGLDVAGSGPMRSMQAAINDASLNPEDIDYINAHGTSTIVGDPVEALAIKRTFGDHAYKLAVSSTKSMTGHMLGAAGAAEAVFSILAINNQIAPPTINLDNPDEGCDLDFVPHTAREMKIDTVLSNSFGFGGMNGSLIFKRI